MLQWNCQETPPRRSLPRVRGGASPLIQVWRRRAYALGERIAERHSATLSYRVAMAYLMNTFALPTSRVNTPSQCAYQSECADQRLQERGLSPLLEAGGADSSRVERVPLMSAGASPDVF